VNKVKNSKAVNSVVTTITDSDVYKTTVDVGSRLVSNVGDLLTGGLLKTQTSPLIYGSPLGGEESLEPNIMALAVAERSLMLSESFQVQGPEEPYCDVRGGKLHVITTPKLYVHRNDAWVATIATQKSKDSNPYYEIMRGETNEKVGYVEKRTAADVKDLSFEFIAGTKDPESDERPPAAYDLRGDFLNRRFVMRNAAGEVVAKVTKQLIAFAAFDHYVVRIAAKMDPILVVACMVVIDKELDEQLKEFLLCSVKKGVHKAATTVAYDLSQANPFS
jgi:uncharacterized protein YxjI